MICAQHTRRAAPRRKVVPLGVSVFKGCERMPVRTASRFSWSLTAQLRSSCLGVIDLQPVQAVDCRSLSTVYGSTAVLPFQCCSSPQATTPHSQHQRRAPASIHPTYHRVAPRRSLIGTRTHHPSHLTALNCRRRYAFSDPAQHFGASSSPKDY